MSHGEPKAPDLDADTRVSGVPFADARPAGARIGATDETLRASGRPSGAASDQAAMLTIGSRIDRYVVLGRLGAGGMGEVFSGYDEELDRRVALKITRPQVLGEGERQGRMRREAQALARLSHPNVVQIHDVGELDGQLFIAMEHVKGETLREWQSRLDPRVPAQRQAILDMYMQAGRGLAAAHAVGIVHRDFKPTNVVVGSDGRARVLDFGLADRSDATPERTGWMETDDGEDRDDHLTATGSILGTPAYMAPEQFRGVKSDARTDVFAFAVALHEALHGQSPFGGDTMESRRAAVVEGRMRAAPSAAIPEWLHRVLARGLAVDPADRYQGMDAMLAALADDPIARRSRRLRWLGLGVAALVVGAALVLAGLWGWERAQEARAEALASERLAAVERRIAELVEAGATDEAERAFFAFADHPDNRGRAALARAWLGRAGRAIAHEDAAAAVDALAAAYTVAIRPEDQTAAIVGLARMFRREMQWGGLLRALATLDARAGEAGDAKDLDAIAGLDELRLDAALARRDLARAAQLLRGPLASSPRASTLAVIEALRPASATEHRHRGFARLADIDGDGRPELALESIDGERQRAPLLRATPRLPAIAAVDLGKDTIRVLAGGAGQPALFVVNDGRTTDGLETEAVVSRWDGGALVEVVRWPEGQVLSALGADIDGDGAHEYLVGTGPYTRRVAELVQDRGGAWSVEAGPPAIDRRRSDVVDLLASDLDGDGGVEVLAVLGPWKAYELQVLRHDRASDSLVTVARRRLGNMSGAAVLHGADGPEIVVSKTDQYPSTVMFPRDRPYGEAAGTYVFRMVDDALVQTAFTPAPVLASGARVIDDRPLAADLDGDGRDEVIVGREIAGARSSVARDVTVIFVRGAGDSLAPVVLADVKPVAALDLDDDGDDELIVSLIDEERRVWVLGSGPEAAPARTFEAAERAGRAPPRDPVLARMWRHADDLEGMGLTRQAAESLVTIADLVGEPELRAQAELAAAALYETLEDDVRAAALFARAAREPGLARRAHEGAARSSLRLARLGEASEHIEALAGGPVDPPAELRAAIAALRGGPVVDHDFTHRLGPAWQIHQPLALRRDGARRLLHVDAPAPGEVLSAPVRWSGESVMLEVDVELMQVEWSAGLEIGLARAGTGVRDATSPLGIDITTTGGGNDRVHQIGCVVYGHTSVARIPFTAGEDGHRLGRFTIRAMLLPGLGEWVCAVERAGGEPLLYSRGSVETQRTEAPLRLTIAARGDWLAADLRRVRLAGVSDDAQATAASGAGPLARLRMVEGDDLGVLDSLAQAPAIDAAEPLLRVGTLARLGRFTEARRALAAVVADPKAAAGQRTALKGLLRARPAVYGPLLRETAGPAALRALIAEAWEAAVVMNSDPAAFEVVWAGLADRDLESDGFAVLKLHGIAAAALGHDAAAAASYRAALRALDDPKRRQVGEIAGEVESERASVHLDLAALALAAGDEAAARRELAPLLESADSALFVADRLLAREDLRPLWSLARR